MDKKTVIVIVGPTAVGKSEFAVELAGRINGEVVSADSMQVYKHMNIGTAKLTPEEMVASNGVFVPHHLIDIKEPKENFSVAEYQKLAREKIEEIYLRKKVPFLVGGTGLYINSVIDNYEFKEKKVDIELRKRLQEEAKEKGNLYLYNKLKKIDPLAAEKIHKNNVKRVVRALEYYYTTGELISSKRDTRKKSIYNTLIFGLYSKRSLLYERINKRVDKMLERGLVDEVKKLLDVEKVPLTSTSMQGLGYKQIAQYLLGEMSYEKAVNILKRDTRRFAKRQLTWFRRDARINWIEVTEETNFNELAEKIKVKIGRIINIGC